MECEKNIRVVTVVHRAQVISELETVITVPTLNFKCCVSASNFGQNSTSNIPLESAESVDSENLKMILQNYVLTDLWTILRDAFLCYGTIN